MTSKINIVFSTDEGYLMPTSVAIHSIIKNLSTNVSVCFYILVEKRLTSESQKILENIVKQSDKCSLQYIVVGEAFNSNRMQIAHISKATYYRLLLPSLMGNEEKCLYLDGDICVNKDISELYNIVLADDEYIGGVKAPNIQLNIKRVKSRLDLLGIPSIDNYINAGVLLMNLKALRENDIEKKLLDLANRDFPVQDQDVLNVACYGHIKILSPKYNAMPQFFSKSCSLLQCLYTLCEIDEAREAPIIIHYADSYKPWRYRGVKFGDLWQIYYSDIISAKLKKSDLRIQKFIDFMRLAFVKLKSLIHG